jgi:hypothetical protein
MTTLIAAINASNLAATQPTPDFQKGERVICTSADYRNEVGTVDGITTNMLGVPLVDVALDRHIELNEALATTPGLEDWERCPLGPSCFYAHEVKRLA